MYREGVDKSKDSSLTCSHFDSTMIATCTVILDLTEAEISYISGTLTNRAAEEVVTRR